MEKHIARAYAGVVLATLFWAGNAVVARAVIDEIPPFALSFWRWAIALVLILPFGLPHLRGRWPILKTHWRALTWLAALSVGSYNTLLYLAAHTTTANNIALMSAASPVLVALLAWLILGQRSSARQSAGIVAALTGMLVIVTQGDWRVLATLDFRLGDLLMIASVTIWAVYTVLLRRHPVPLHPLALMTALVVLGVPMILPFYLWELANGQTFSLAGPVVPTLLYVGLFPSILAYTLWNQGVAALGPSRTAIFFYLMPVFTAVLAILFLGETLRGFHAAGGGLILVGLYLATRSPGAPAATSA